MDKQPRKLTVEQQTHLEYAQQRLERGSWSFKRYHMYLSVYVYGVE